MKNEFVFSMAASYAAKGIPVVVTHGIDDNGNCSCGRPSCNGGSRGKHPVALKWQESATADEDFLLEQLDTEAHRNIGILLGPKGGVIDIEFDDAEGAETVKALGIDLHDTPTYKSGGRSVHRLYRYDPRLPAKAVVKYKGLEVRTGGGGMSAQSIVPPSTHHSGSVYEWLPGKSMEEIEPMEIPEDLLALINEGSGPEKAAVPAIDVVRKGVDEGDRHNSMVRLAARQAFRMTNLDDQREQADVLDTLYVINEARINPPLDRDEVDTAFTSAIRYAKSKRLTKRQVMDDIESIVDDHAAEEEARRQAGVVTAAAGNSLGLERREDGWHPGLWSLCVVHSTPPVNILRVAVPSGDGWTESEVEVTMEEFKNPSRMALRILEATRGDVNVDVVPGEWAAMWVGQKSKKDQAGQTGLCARLLAAKEDRAPDPESSRDAVVAANVLEVIDAVPDGDDELSPAEVELPRDGSPTWVTMEDGRPYLAVCLTSMWSLVGKSLRDVSTIDKRTWRQQVTGDGRGDLRVFNPLNKPRSKWVLLSPEHIEAVELASQGKLTSTGLRTRWQ